MAISFVAAGTVVTGTNPIVTVPAGYAAGDLLLIVVSSTNTPGTPAGWTLYSAQGSGQYITIYGKIATSSESSVGVSGNDTAVMLAYRGATTYDVVSSYSTGTSTSATTLTATATFTNDYVISIYADATGTASTWTAPASTTQRVNSSNSATVKGLLIVDELQASSGTTTARTATISNSIAWSSVAIAIRQPQAFYVDPDSGSDANSGISFATAWKTISAATAPRKVFAGDTVRVKQSPIYNTGVNATWTSPSSRGIDIFGTQTITAATNATPIVCTLANHGYSTGDVIQITGAVGNTAANGNWKVTVTNSSTFSLDDSSGNGTWTSGGAVQPIFCRTITTATPLVKPIASFANLKTVSLGTRAAWVGANANITTTLNTTFPKGGPSDTITIAVGATTGKMAYYTLPATLDLSSYQQLSLFINQLSGTTLGGLTISLCADTTGDTPVNTFTIPSTGVLSNWAPLTFDNGSALGSSIQSIAIYRPTVTGVAQTFTLNSIVACKAPSSVDALSNLSLITKNNSTEGTYAVGGFGGSDGSIVFLDCGAANSNPTTTGGAYYGTTETVALYRIAPFLPLGNTFITTGGAVAATTFATLSGTSLYPIVFSGGWNTSDMSSVVGETWFDTQGNAYALQFATAATNNYITLDRINTSRGLVGIYIGSASQTGITIQNYKATSIGNNGAIYQTGTNVNLFTVNNCNITNSIGYGIYAWGSSTFATLSSITNVTASGCSSSAFYLTYFSTGVSYLLTNNVTVNTCGSQAFTYGSTNYSILGSVTNIVLNYCKFSFNVNSPWGLTFNNITITPAPAGIPSVLLGIGPSTSVPVPQNSFCSVRNVTVNTPTVAYTKGASVINVGISGNGVKYYNCSFAATNVTYSSFCSLSALESAAFYNCSGVGTISWTNSGAYIQSYMINNFVPSQDENNTVGNNKIYFQGGLATSQTSVRHTASGYAWSMAPTSTTTVTSTYPMKLKIASVAANSGSAVTITAWMRRTNTGLTMQLVCPGGQPYGPTSDTTASMTAAADTWEQLSISFTPTQNAVYDIYAYAYGGTTYTGYVDDLGVSQ